MDNLFRQDEYGLAIFAELNGKFVTEKLSSNGNILGIDYNCNITNNGNTKIVEVQLNPQTNISVDRLGIRLGIDCYMEKYPDWNNKFFPTAMRCESNGFWGVFVSPLKRFMAVCSPSNIVSWANEYNKTSLGDVGHRIYTASVDFVNRLKQPDRHIKSPAILQAGTIYNYVIYYGLAQNLHEALQFVEDNAGIRVAYPSKFMLKPNEKVVFDDKEFAFDSVGRHVISGGKQAETSVFVRQDWDYYMRCAYESACRNQQKAGTHCESWYGYFTKALYLKFAGSAQEIKTLSTEFDEFVSYMFKGKRHKKFVRKTLPHRLQNTSAMISLLSDFYQLTSDMKYLEWANDLARWLMKLQAKDGSYRSHGTHYTCVIYPAKSMLELYEVEKEAGLMDRALLHFDSAKRAIDNLYILKDNIQTEGQMTFEDGMISCETLQLAYLATLTNDKARKEQLTSVAEEIYGRHYCLEQNIVPDCRSIGATLRFWEARYDVNFNKNMLNAPHGWTSWKNYASYYLYILTGKLEYLTHLMNTMGACMQMIDDNGVLNWAFIIDPCVVGKQMVKSDKTGYGFEMQDVVIGEQYLPTVSEWFRQDNKNLPLQYLRAFNNLEFKLDKHGSCDNDVHEHFKCLMETVFGKAFVHIGEQTTLYNCSADGDGYVSRDKWVNTLVAYSDKDTNVIFNKTTYPIKAGVNVVKLK